MANTTDPRFQRKDRRNRRPASRSGARLTKVAKRGETSHAARRARTCADGLIGMAAGINAERRPTGAAAPGDGSSGGAF